MRAELGGLCDGLGLCVLLLLGVRRGRFLWGLRREGTGATECGDGLTVLRLWMRGAVLLGAKWRRLGDQLGLKRTTTAELLQYFQLICSQPFGDLQL